MIKKEIPYWCKMARATMILKGISVNEMASALGKSKSYISSVLSGGVVAPTMINAISDYLDISNDYYVGESQKCESGRAV